MPQDKHSEKAKKWLKTQTQPYRAFIVLLTILTVFATAFSVLFAYLVRYLINSASSGNAKLLLVFSSVLLLALFLKIGLKTLTGFLSEKLRAKMLVQLRTKIFSNILRSNYNTLQGFHSGELLNRLTSDLSEVVGYSVGILPSVAGMAVQCFGAIAALLTLDPLFTAVYVVCGCVFGGITALFRNRIKKSQKDVLQADGKVRSFIQESLGSILTLKAYTAEERATNKEIKLSDAYYNARMKRNLLHSFMSFIFGLLSNFGLILAVVWCSISILNGNQDYGSILSIILLLMQLQQPFASFSSILPAYYARLASGERLSEIDDVIKETLVSDHTRIDNIYHKLEKISFKNIDFSYDRDCVLKNASVDIEKGKIICLTGSSGAGKSTLFKLLLNVFNKSAGEISLIGDGFDMQLTSGERGLFAYVPQGNFLFSGTIYENLTFFSETTDKASIDEKMKKALEIACADFVWELPEGLDTVLLEDGEGLSEGQLQRLAVARAVLSERPILLLDEATSALDAETEKALLQNIKKLENKTCLIVTHRPAALDIADNILSVENKKIRVVK